MCNYGPGGNEAGGSMYKIGKPGSLCSNGSEKGLCLWRSINYSNAENDSKNYNQLFILLADINLMIRL